MPPRSALVLRDEAVLTADALCGGGAAVARAHEDARRLGGVGAPGWGQGWEWG